MDLEASVVYRVSSKTARLHRETDEGIGGMGWWLRVLYALEEDISSVPITHVGHLTTW